MILEYKLTENNIFSEEHDIACTSSKQKKDCCYREADELELAKEKMGHYL